MDLLYYHRCLFKGCVYLLFLILTIHHSASKVIEDFSPMEPQSILVVPDLHDAIHIGLFTTVGKRLVERGHNVSILSHKNLLNDDLNRNFNIISYESTTNVSSCTTDRISLTEGSNDCALVKLINIAWYWYKHSDQDAYLNECSSILGNDKLIKNLIRSQFNKVLCDVSSPCCSILARYINVTFVNFASKGALGTRHFRWYYVPNVLSVVPEFMSGFTNRMDRWQRTQNVLFYLHSVIVYDFWMFGAYDRLKHNHNILTNEKAFDIIGKADLLLLNTDLTVEFPRPYMQNVIFVGGISGRNSSKLDKDLELFLQSSGQNSVIVASIHSKFSSTKPENLQLLWKVLTSVPQKVVWVDNGDVPKMVTANENVTVIHVNKLNDVLGHDSVKVFVNHGNIDLAYMSIYHAVPSVVIPLFADEYEVAVRLEAKEIAQILHIQRLTRNALENALDQALHNATLKEQVIWWSEVQQDFHDILLPPIDRAVFWIEHVMKFSGEYLRSAAFQLNTLQYFLLDVLLFVLICVFLFIYIIRKFCLLCCCNKRTFSKDKNNKVKQQ
ncbi:UDP-glucuronosyltransferase 2B15-like [Antedon mediterranea]|uniref:UDP-glucuronosyltransferase 2B15-like n=1 Tax=Antedon mediterranea TaxID=105859 RepID=UPI003AF84651